jgi:hypothetical protein
MAIFSIVLASSHPAAARDCCLLDLGDSVSEPSVLSLLILAFLAVAGVVTR